MYKVMLVDDEIGVRNSIRMKIDWEATGFEIVAEASSGKEALQQLSAGSLPDLLISDIRMPLMDGITLIRECRSRYPGIRMVVLSGYSDFEYMKSAIQLGVKDYLLKPVVRSDLIALLARLAEELREEREREQERQRERWTSNQQLQLLQEQCLLQLVKDDWYSMSAVKERLVQLQLAPLAADDWKAQFVMLEMRVPEGRLRSGQGTRELLQLAFQLTCKETAASYGGVYPFYDVTHSSMMFFLIARPDAEAAEACSARFVTELKQNVSRYLRLAAVEGIGEVVEGLRQLKDGYASCMLSWSESTVQREPAGSRSPDSLRPLPPETERKMIQAVESLDRNAFAKQLEAIFPPGEDMPKFAFTFMALRVILLFDSIAKKFELADASFRSDLWSCQMTIASYPSKEQVLDQIRQLAQRVIEAVRQRRATGGQQLIETIRKYVDDNYGYELTLSALAELFHLNETYLSGLFKQHAGINFSDYLTKVRLAKAAELLKENELKLTDIAMLVGYSTSSYFSTSFKKHYGQSPKEYRDAYLAAHGT